MKSIRSAISILFCTILFSSCCTLFCGSRQNITFQGIPGTKIYEAHGNLKIAEIGDSESVTVNMKKSMDGKWLVAKKDGYKPLQIMLDSSFNPTALWNILFWPGFIVDFASQTLNKYDNEFVQIEMERE